MKSSLLDFREGAGNRYCGVVGGREILMGKQMRYPALTLWAFLRVAYSDLPHFLQAEIHRDRQWWLRRNWIPLLSETILVQLFGVY